MLPEAFRGRGPLFAALVAGLVLWAMLFAAGHYLLELPGLELVAIAGLLGTAVATAAVGWLQAAELRGLAHTDPLTGLTNHRGFHEALRAGLERAAHERTALSLVTIDLDDFKAINDARGHPYGDEVLRGVGARLRGAVRSSDVAARVGGEEFALILPRSGSDAAFEIAERARAAISSLPVHGSELSCSAGIATFPSDAEDSSTLLQLADGALYWAKSAGKQRTRRFDPERVERSPNALQREEVERLLRTPEALRPQFQPIVSLSTGRLVAYEALARFPEAAARPPAAWFAMAHACGLGPELEAAAVHAALKPVGRPPGTQLALNVSPSVLASSAMQAALPRDLHEIVIEVTEHEAISEDAEVAGALTDLRERGARIAVDDAGAGYSGLQQLTRIQPDVVKLDRHLTEGIHADPARLALVESFVRFARRTGATVCAEGIETLDELMALADLDVELGQGFALGTPAEPWTPVQPRAARVCRAGLADAMRPPEATADEIVAGDRGLERLSARIAGARSRHDLERALPLLAAELGADEVAISQWHPEESLLETLADMTKEEQTLFEIEQFPLSRRVLSSQRAAQVLLSDPDADPGEAALLLSYEFSAVLMVPVIHAGESVGVIEAYRREERPFARIEINRARIISNQFSSLLYALFGSERPVPPRERRS